MENLTNAEDLNKRTLVAQEKIKAGGKDALETHFELNKLAEESEGVRDEAEKANAEFGKKKKSETENVGPTEIAEVNTESKENSIENKTIGPIFMVYRENKNWDKYVPMIIEHIESLGGKIETKSFPRGTEEEAIEQWYKKNYDELQDKYLLTDRTCHTTTTVEDTHQFSLDYFLEQSGKREIEESFKNAFGEKGLKELNFNSLEGYKESYTKIFKLALENYSPEKVTFAEDSFGHHSGSIARLSGLDGRSAKNDDEVLEFIKECLTAAGYPESNISVVSNVKNINPKEIESMKNEWFFMDTHNQMFDIYEKQGLSVYEPSEIIKLVQPKNSNSIGNNLLVEIDNTFKKINSIEDFISLYGTDPNLPLNESLARVITRIGNEEKLVEIINSLLDLNKNNPKWKEDKCIKVRYMLYFDNIIPINEQSKEQINKKIEEIMAQ